MADTEDYDETAPDGSWEKPKKATRAQPHKPAGVKQPQDRKPPAKSAAQREAEGDPTLIVEYGGVEFEILADQDDWPLDALEFFAVGNQIGGLRELLGQKQWLQFKSKFNKRRYLDEFAELVSAEFGFGNSGN